SPYIIPVYMTSFWVIRLDYRRPLSLLSYSYSCTFYPLSDMARVAMNPNYHLRLHRVASSRHAVGYLLISSIDKDASAFLSCLDPIPPQHNEWLKTLSLEHRRFPSQHLYCSATEAIAHPFYFQIPADACTLRNTGYRHYPYIYLFPKNSFDRYNFPKGHVRSKTSFQTDCLISSAFQNEVIPAIRDCPYPYLLSP